VRFWTIPRFVVPKFLLFVGVPAFRSAELVSLATSARKAGGEGNEKSRLILGAKILIPSLLSGLYARPPSSRSGRTRRLRKSLGRRVEKVLNFVPVWTKILTEFFSSLRRPPLGFGSSQEVVAGCKGRFGRRLE
jgi:hypothetical protein